MQKTLKFALVFQMALYIVGKMENTSRQQKHWKNWLTTSVCLLTTCLAERTNAKTQETLNTYAHFFAKDRERVRSVLDNISF